MKLVYPGIIPVICFLLLLSCSSTPKITSQFTEPEKPDSVTTDFNFLRKHSERHALDGLAVYIANNETHLYLLIDFVRARLFEQAQEFGFTLYIDNKDRFKRSFGISYPTGIYYELGQYPGAQKAYLEEPNWSNIPENEAILESIHRNMTNNALLVQRRNRRDEMRPFPIPLSRLEAQNLKVHLNDDGRNGQISFVIPLQTLPTSQFSPDINSGETFDLGLEINPIQLFNLDIRGVAPQISNEMGGGRASTEAEEQELEHLARVIRHMGDPYEQWIKVQLSQME